MKRMIALVSLAALVACTEEGATAPEMTPEVSPAFVIQTVSGGGVGMAPGSACEPDVATLDFYCSFRATDLPDGPANAVAFGYWTVKFKCVAPRSGKGTAPAYALIQNWVVTHDQVKSVNGEIWADKVQVQPPSESSQAPYLCQTAPFTAVKYLEKPTQHSWKIMAMWALDVNQYYVQISETL
ncbi:MAG TPA: hypothetical protein VFZ93_11800 [Albitalea sp.]